MLLKVNVTDVMEFHKGKNYKLVDKGTVPVYNIGNIPGYTDKSICDKPCVALGVAGTIGKPRKFTPPYWITKTQIYVTAKEGYDIDFIYMLLWEQQWQKYTNRFAIPQRFDLEMFLNEDVEVPAMADERINLGYIFIRYLKQIELTKKLIEMHNQMNQDMFYLMFGDLNLAVSDNEKARQCYPLK